MTSTRYRNLWLLSLAVIMVAVFFALHPVNSSFNKVIAGDGLGYYSYLPAKFIYHDTTLNFKWFDKPFYDNYGAGASANPTGNFLVPYKDKMINLYYPCLSFLQLPFFFISHAAAILLHYPADGFSQPYQVGMGISAIFYTLLGLWFCSRLLFKLSGNTGLSLLIPVLVFFGTNLFTCSLYIGCYTHCYSFCFTALGFYAAWQFFNSVVNKGLYFVVIAFCSLVIFFLRPMNVILLIGLLYFFQPITLAQLKNNREEKKGWLAVIVVLLITLLWYNLSTIYVQTHALFVNTYTGFKFYFNRWDHVYTNFVGFQNGILWYTPLILICFVPVLLVKKQPKILWLILPLLGVILLCSFWWYWQVINRTLADLSVILMILLWHIFTRFRLGAPAGKISLTIMLLCVSVFQLKAYQLRNGILNGYNTYKDYYFNYFFRTRPASIFPVDPKTIIARKGYLYDFETGSQNYVTEKNKFHGKRSATLNDRTEFSFGGSFIVPFVQPGIKKVRLSFYYYRSEELKGAQLICSYRRQDSTVKAMTFYIDETNSKLNTWEYMEFGDWIPDEIKEGDTLNFFFWNPGRKNEAFIDDLRLEFMVTDGSDEMLM